MFWINKRGIKTIKIDSDQGIKKTDKDLHYELKLSCDESKD